MEPEKLLEALHTAEKLKDTTRHCYTSKGRHELSLIHISNDIDRNGLMHNLVVYPRTDGKQTKYVLLSGERRYKALNYLQARGDAKWNTVKNCRVVTTPLEQHVHFLFQRQLPLNNFSLQCTVLSLSVYIVF